MLFDKSVGSIDVLGEYIYVSWISSDLSDSKIYRIENDGSMEYEEIKIVFD